MCGIAGHVAPRTISGLRRCSTAFPTSLKHRGPDDAGFLTWEAVPSASAAIPARAADGTLALIHRRLSMWTSASAAGSRWSTQPADTAIVLNGEIYNHLELRRELEAEGVEFRLRPIPRCSFNCSAGCGIDGLKRFVGMFAFAFFDARLRRLWLVARSVWNQAPLFFGSRTACSAFASEIRPLVDLGFAAPRGRTRVRSF